MKMISKLVCATLMSTCVLAMADTSSATTNATATNVNLKTPAAQLVAKLMNGQGTIVESFPAVGGLTGFVVKSSQSGNSGIVYADKKGTYLFAGSIVNAQGQDMTQMYTNQYVTSKIAGPAYEAALGMNTFTQGSDKAPHKAIVIFDPNCVYCHMLYQELKPLMDAGQVQIQWLPVAFRDPTSPGKSAALLNAGSGAAALLDQNEKSFNDQTEEGAITPLQPNDKDPAISKVFTEVQDNTQFFSKFGFQGTPTILYKQNDGKIIMVPGYVQGQAFQTMISNMGSSF